jgi:beta-mannanase
MPSTNRASRRRSALLLAGALGLFSVVSGVAPVAAAPAQATAVVSAATAAKAGTTALSAPPVPAALNTKLACAYTHNDLSELQSFGWLVGRQLDCASLFNDTSTSWAVWEDPWFAHMPLDQPQFAWRKWLASGPKTVLLSQSLVPDGVDPLTWRALGAAGAYDDHIRTLATNLVTYGMGDTIIRLAHEGNGDWSYDYVGPTAQDHADWRTYWAHFASVMRSVPGASFEFDWNVNAASPAVAFDDYYPGDSAVDVIGIDQYDWASAWVGTAQPARWTYQRDIALGINAVVDYAAAHGKPLSIPEWGLVPTTVPQGMGDDPYFVDQLAAIVRTQPVRYQSYFNSAGSVTMRLQDLAGSRAAWKRHYGSGGDSYLPSPLTPPPPPPVYPAVSADLDTRTACLDERSSVSALLSAGWLVGRPIDCAVLHNDGQATWAAWRDPWVTRWSASQPDYQWATWLAAGARRRTLVLAQSLVPAEAPADWRVRGVAGEYDDQIRALGATLVSRGLGDIVIRLAPKANGAWQADNMGSTAADFSAWSAFWARAAGLLRATPGSSFEMEWSISAGYRALPLDQVYPGDSAVDVVGVSALDSGPTVLGSKQPDRWDYQVGVPGGLTQVVAFGRTHGKPIAVSEWAVLPTTRADGVGDDAFYADQVATLVRNVPTRYQAYVNTASSGVLRLQDAAGTRASWKRHYGATGDTLRTPTPLRTSTT